MFRETFKKSAEVWFLNKVFMGVTAGPLTFFDPPNFRKNNEKIMHFFKASLSHYLTIIQSLKFMKVILYAILFITSAK